MGYLNAGWSEHPPSYQVPNFRKIAEQTAKSNPDMFPPAVKATTATVTTCALTPFSSLLVNHVCKGLSVRESAQIVMRNPYAGVKPTFYGMGLDFAAVFATRDYVQKQLCQNTTMSEEQASTAGYLVGSTAATVATNPLDYTRVQMVQNVGGSKKSTMSEIFRRSSFKDFYRGLIPSCLRGGLLWGFGLGVGQKLHDNIKEATGDNTVGFLAAKSAGWTLGNFIASPFYTLGIQLKSDMSVNNMQEVLRNMGVIYDPKKYNPENYKVESAAKRALILMPRDPEKKPHITEKETTRLRAHHAITNLPKLWRGFTKAIPLILVGGNIVGLAERVARAFTESCKEEN